MDGIKNVIAKIIQFVKRCFSGIHRKEDKILELLNKV